ncbi:unnamed protein product [Penicillium salamii]|uniref:Uncharacterized protein n=1 Tax=Penicillium salamii TaxID=1612424 RepID=A0A9W4NGZ3_9EURO|nr:unnamed protein product [Penicillium salamii]CAG8375258.1 unnamed protein product [Penicillium salamii]CAG8375707.1 unnamed protein product [Penicillium salamii]CAG8415772.1 unnamed protein product [Penicillium salamii]
MAGVIKDTVTNILGKFQGTSEETPREPSTEEFQTLVEKYNKAGQGHVFAFAEQLSTVEKPSILPPPLRAQ